MSKRKKVRSNKPRLGDCIVRPDGSIAEFVRESDDGEQLVGLSASLCGQLIVSETLFALVYSFLWDGQWPTRAQAAAALLFTLGILASIKAHR